MPGDFASNKINQKFGLLPAKFHHPRMVGTSAKAFMAALNLPDPDVLIKWGQKTYGFVPWAWKFVTRQETRASRKLSTRLDLLVDNIWPFLSTGSPRIDSLRCVLEELFRLSEGEDQKIKSQILNRYRILGEWLSCRYIQIRHTLLKRPTPIALTDYFVELNMILGGIEKVLAEFSLGISSLANCPQELRQNYLKFRDTYNHFLTGYEALCRDAKATFREIPEASFKRIE